MSDRPDEHPAVLPGEADRPVVHEPPASADSAPPGLAATTTTAPRRTSPLAAVALVLVLAEAGALFWVYTHPKLPPDLEGRLTALDQATHAAHGDADQAAAAARDEAGKVAALQRSVAALQDRPAPQPAPSPQPTFDPKPLTDEVDGLKSAIDQLKTDTANAVALATAAQKAGQSDTATTGGLTGRIDDNAAKLASLSTRLDDLDTKLGAAAGEIGKQGGELSKQGGELSAQTAALATLSSRFDQASNESRRIASLASGAERAARLQAASVALSIGRPTGAIPDAPPALARFSTEAPPTEASLILAFPDAAAATLKASEPQTAGQGFFKRLWTRAQSAVTVRDGARVIVGDPASGIVAAARERLAAGDLQGAVSTLGALSGAAADAMDEWRSRAAALVDARAALASMMSRQ